MKKSRTAAGFAILAAALYAVNVPLSKILIQYVEPTMMAACSIWEQAWVCQYAVAWKCCWEKTISGNL